MHRIIKIDSSKNNNNLDVFKKLLLNKDILHGLDERNIKIIINENNDTDKFTLKLIGYDGEVKQEYNTFNEETFNEIFGIVDQMPMRRIEIINENINKMDGGDIKLYASNDNGTILKGTGYKNEEVAKSTINLIKKRSIIYQKAVIITMYNRAKFHKNITPEMRDAMKIFKNWLSDNKNTKVKYEYLPIDLINKYEKIADIYDISRVSRGLDKPIKSEYGFLAIYRKVKGDYRKLPFIPIFKKKPNGQDYDILREKFINARLGQMKQRKINLYNKSGKYKDLPTKQHTVLIMNGYSPDKDGLMKRIKLLNEL